MRRCLPLIALAACHSDIRHVNYAFVANEPCGQGPYDVHLRAEGKMGSEGVEVIACTPHQLAGHVQMIAAGIPMRSVPFGDHPDNGRCLAGGPILATAPAAGGTTTAAPSPPAGPGARAPTPALVAQPAAAADGISPDEICAPYHLPGQELLIDTMTTTDLLRPGTDIHVRIWSDAPMDLQGVVFLVRHAISTHTRAEEQKEWAELDRAPAHDEPERPAPPADHGVPPAPLAEQRPSRPGPGAVWIPGSWTWTGTAWGWTGGFWRDDRVAMPAPRVEIPGPPPVPTAIWVTGSWQLRAGAWVWIGGRWRP